MMSDPAIAALIREVLAEELGKLKDTRPAKAAGRSDDVRHENVSITSDADLAAFAKRLLKAADNPKTRRDIEQGRLVFHLAGSMPGAASATPAAAAQPATAQPAATSHHGETVIVDTGFFSERQVDKLPKETRTVRLGKRVKLTPLARDRLSHRRIKIERTDT